MTEASPGRRERKKAATRQAIADAALELFLERGYEDVSIRDIAEAADVSVTTLFKHFTGKEALVFDRDIDRESELVAVVRERAEGESILEALRRHALETSARLAEHPQAARFTELVASTPALLDYSERMWTRHTASLGAAIAEAIGAPRDDLAVTALARYVLDIPGLIRARPDPRRAIDALFDLLDSGWQDVLRHPSASARSRPVGLADFPDNR